MMDSVERIRFGVRFFFLFENNKMGNKIRKKNFILMYCDFKILVFMVKLKGKEV